MANTGNTQQEINYGASANDGQGDPLRTAFIKTDDNFDNVWLAGPVGSNITIGNNTIQSNNTNGNIILKPNGTGIVQANASIIPNADGVRDLGSSSLAWRRAYINELLPEDLTVSGDAVIQGNLTVQGDTIQIGNITTDTLTIQLANTAANATAAAGAGITVGANDNIATILYNSTANRWNVSVGMSAVGNISAPYFSGNGSLLTGITSYGNANVAANLAAFSNNPISTTGTVNTGILSVTGNVTANSAGNLWAWRNDTMSYPSGASWRSDRFTLDEYISSATDGYLNLQTYDNTSNVATELHMEHGVVQLNIYNGNNVTWEFDSAGNLTLPGNTFAVNYANGTAVNLSTYGNANVAANLAAFSNNPISTTGNVRTGNIVATGAFTANSSGNVWNISNDFLSFPSGASWRSDRFSLDEYISSAVDGYLNLQTYDNTSNVATELHMEHGVIQFNIYNGALKTWNFDEDGNLALPRGGIVYETNIPGGVLAGNTIALAPSGGIDADQQLLIYPTVGPVTDDNHLHLTTGNLYNTELYLGNDDLYVKLANTGNVVINSNDGAGSTAQWNFGTDGNLTLPYGAVIRDTAGNAVAFGLNAGLTNQNDYAVAIGNGAGEISQGFNTVAVGYGAGANAQGSGAVSVGVGAGYITQGASTVAIGASAGYQAQAVYAVAIGLQAGQTSQAQDAIAIGRDAGKTSQGEIAVAIGHLAGNASQGNAAVAIGASAGQTTQGVHAVAIGTDSGATTQGNRAVAIGYLAGSTAQGTAAVAIGYYAGELNQGNNSIIINATDTALQQTTANTFTVAPVRNDVANVAEILFYDTTSKEITYGNTISVAGNITGGNIITTGNVSGNVSGFAIGYRDIPQVSFTGNATIATADAGKHFYSTQSTDYVLTIANNVSQGFQTGAAITVVNQGTGNITVAQGSGVTLYLAGNATAGNRTVATFGMATIMKVATDTWFINGTGVS